MVDATAFTIFKTTKLKIDHNKGSQKRNEQTVPMESKHSEDLQEYFFLNVSPMFQILSS